MPVKINLINSMQDILLIKNMLNIINKYIGDFDLYGRLFLKSPSDIF